MTTLAKLARPVVLAVAASAGLGGVAVDAVRADALYGWTQLGPADASGEKTEAQVLARVIVSGDAESCPALSLDGGETLEMTERTRPESGFDAIKVCEATLANAAGGTASFDGLSVSIPNLGNGVPLQQFFVFGDTGCRNNKKQGPCSDAKVWPFKALIDNAVARIKADTVPTVLHVGDFRYANKGEPDSWTAPEENGEAWGGWKQEFFDPAKALLERGTWIPVRGNHDACSEHGLGWLYFFGHTKEGCKTLDDPNNPMLNVLPAYGLDGMLGNGTVRIVVLDTIKRGDGSDGNANKIVKRYKKQLNNVRKRYVKGAGDDTMVWLISHVPLFSLNGTEFKAHQMLDALNRSKLRKKKSMKKVPLMISGHRHEFELVNAEAGNPGSARPIQYVVGNSGVLLSGKANLQLLCDAAKVHWTPTGEDGETTENWIVMRRPTFGYLEGNATGEDFGIGFDMHFYNPANEDWWEDATVSCHSDQANAGRFVCPWLPQAGAGKVKCP